MRFLGGLRKAAGVRSVRCEARVVGDILRELSARADGALADHLLQQRDAAGAIPHEDLRILVNGRSVAFLDGLATALDEEDVVTVHHSGARGYPGG